MAVSCHAPGKVILAGEWAVLAPGGTAVVAAVRPGLTIEVEPADAWCVDAPDLGVRGSTLEDAKVAFVAAAARAISAEAEVGPHSVVVRRDRGGLPKAGLGHSAAVVAGVVRALLWSSGRDATRQEIFALARAAHDEAQGAHGSGCDVAACVHGGLIRFTNRGAGRSEVTSLRRPPDLRVGLAFCGRPSSTAERIRSLRAAPQGAAVEWVKQATAALAAKLDEGDSIGVIEALRAAGEAYERMDRDLGLKGWDEELTRMVAAASPHGAAKVSGAGGGDCVVGLAASSEALSAMIEAWRALGATPIDVRIDDDGLAIAECSGE